jgi:ATP-binding cassette subfamily B protein
LYLNYTIFAITGLSLIPPLLYRDLIDNALPNQDVTRLIWLTLGMIGIPIINAFIGLGQRYLSATIGEHLIADLRNALFNHLHAMGLRFFTQIKSFVTYSVDPILRRVASLCRPLTHRDASVTVKIWIH